MISKDFLAHTLLAGAFCFALVIAAVAAHGQTYTDLHDFNASAGDPTNFNVARPAQGRDGNFYSESDGPGNGTVFKITPSGTVTVILSFDGTNGSDSVGGMTLGSDGNLYGDTWSGGTSGQGITFKITPAGTLTPLHNFTNTGDGNNPANALVQGTTGTFYGTTNNVETIYSVTSTGKFKTLHTMSSSDGYDGGQLSISSTGVLYGGMGKGGANGDGTLFSMTPAGVYKVLHNFSGSDGAVAPNGMIEAPNGVFYGTTQQGGANNAGAVFKITAAGVYTLLHSLSSASEGNQPLGLMLATDGNMYGVTESGGSANCGTIIKVTQAGAFSVIYTFDGTHGCNSAGYLTQGTDGQLYGLTNGGGADGNGTFFSLDLGIAPFVVLQTTSGDVGSKVGILGEGFTSSSVVHFNGVTAGSTLTEAGYITATVPTGATSGYVTVTTGSTTLTSTQKYTVHNSWSQGAAIPVPVICPAVGYIGAKIYVAGGGNGSVAVGNNQVYNPANNTWSTAAAMPTALGCSAYAVVKEILYVIGGDNGATPTDLVQAYNPKTNTWSTKTPMPIVRGSIAVAVVDGTSIYVMGGNGATLRLDNLEKYDTTTDTWTEESPLLVGRSETTGGLLGSTIVSSDGDTNSGTTGDTEAYDVSTNTWREVTADPTPRGGPCFGAISSLLYLAGGDNLSGTAISVTESFKLTTDKWTTLLSMPNAVMWSGSTVATGQLYCFGGTPSASGTTPENYVQIYQP